MKMYDDTWEKTNPSFSTRFHISWGKFGRLFRGSTGGFLDDYRGMFFLQKSNLFQQNAPKNACMKFEVWDCLLVISGNVVSFAYTKQTQPKRKTKQLPITNECKHSSDLIPNGSDYEGWYNILHPYIECMVHFPTP